MELAKLRDAGVAPARLERFELYRTSRPRLWIGPHFEPEEHREPIALCNGSVLPKLNYLCLNGVHIDWNVTHISNLTVLDLRRLAMECNPTLYQFLMIAFGNMFHAVSKSIFAKSKTKQPQSFLLPFGEALPEPPFPL